MKLLEDSRIDKWLWCVRIFKTRSLAADACKGGKVKLNDEPVKPAKTLKPGDRISFRRGIIRYEIEVIQFPKNRVSAKEVNTYYTDHTPHTELVKLDELKYVTVVKRDRGSGRPTKKDRRNMQDFTAS